jgi:hypothetical protein
MEDAQESMIMVSKKIDIGGIHESKIAELLLADEAFQRHNGGRVNV